MTAPLPYTVAVLCYLFDSQGRLLLLHRRRQPNKDRYSPIGGKLDQPRGESPTDCAAREIFEETGVRVDLSQLHLTGIVSETGYEDRSHWLMFLYEVTHPVDVADGTRFDEGRLEWHQPQDVPKLAIPDSDRLVIWPLFCKYRRGFFAAHIDCSAGQLSWHLQQPAQDVTTYVNGITISNQF